LTVNFIGFSFVNNRCMSPTSGILVNMKLASVVPILAFGLGMATAAAVELTSPLKNVQFVHAKAMQAPTELQPARNYQKIKSYAGYPMGRSAEEALQKAGASVPGNAYQNITALTKSSTQYAIDVLWDDKPISLLFDTGSSDTWALHTNYTCLGAFGSPTNKTECMWGSTTIDGFRYGETPDVHLAIAFGSGEMVTGPMGRSDITVGSLEVPEVQCGLVNETYWIGNNVTSGLLGLAYPSLTSSYMGPVGSEMPGFREPYEPFFSRMVASGLVEPVFSIAIERNSNDGIIAWGGLPPFQMWSTSTFAEADIIVVSP
jgi:aspartyl protease